MIVGLCGFISSGKSTAANILIDNHGFTRLAFADPLKDACSKIFGWPRELLEGDTSNSRDFREKVDTFWSTELGYDITPRQALQVLGTEAGREIFGENLWTASLKQKILDKKKKDAILRQTSNIVITDVRFPNEIMMLKSLGAKIVEVSRGEKPVWYKTALTDNVFGTKIMDIDYPNVHISEYAWIGHTQLTVNNNSDLDALGQEISDKIMRTNESI